MEEDDNLYGEIDLGAFMKSIGKQREENEKSILEHLKRLQNQQSEIESQNQKLFSFVCDWQ